METSVAGNASLESCCLDYHCCCDKRLIDGLKEKFAEATRQNDVKAIVLTAREEGFPVVLISMFSRKFMELILKVQQRINLFKQEKPRLSTSSSEALFNVAFHGKAPLKVMVFSGVFGKSVAKGHGL
ncbi:hypothetical protein PVK06_042584 [Gossypium arboreum]|uniref:Uncharacterized protein n=1 Tax=Gossypium arboreum TaxID=29729 RepID=A0ABR0MLD8_GOSAR|nr:hypothetical protein PVK06_042584 [Gossypium arboreum]